MGGCKFIINIDAQQLYTTVFVFFLRGVYTNLFYNTITHKSQKGVAINQQNT